MIDNLYLERDAITLIVLSEVASIVIINILPTLNCNPKKGGEGATVVVLGDKRDIHVYIW